MFSANEVLSLFEKALRGAGFPVGHAQEIAAACVWLKHQEIAAERIILDACAAGFNQPDILLEDCTLLLSKSTLCTYLPTARDMLFAEEVDIVKCQMEKLGEYSDRLANAFQLSLRRAGEADMLLVRDEIADHLLVQPEHTSLTIAPEIHRQLSDFAQKTYVPSSEISRAKGAGAGLVDSD